MIDWQDFEQKLNYIEDIYSQYRIPIKDGEGLSDVICEAMHLIDGTKKDQSSEGTKKATEAYHYTYMLHDSLSTCINNGWDVSTYLKNITTGKVNYGTPKSSVKNEIYFKDFETELLIGSILMKNSIEAELLEDFSSPLGDIKSGDIFVEVKHPDSTGQLGKLLKKFNDEMIKNQSFGIFAVGLEDMFNYGDVFFFDTVEKFESWQSEKYNMIQNFIKQSLPKTKNCTNILGIILTSTKIYNIGDFSKLWRHGNSVLFDRNGVSNSIIEASKNIVECFNPNPIQYHFK